MKRKSKFGMIFGITLAAVFVIALVWVLMTFAAPQSINGSPGSAGCNIAPGVTISAVDSIQPGTSVTLGANFSIENGAYVATPSLAQGSSLQYLTNATNYLNGLTDTKTLVCGTNPYNVKMYAYAAPTETIYKSNYATLLDSVSGAGAANSNETNSTNAITDTIKLSGTPLKSTGDMLIVVEYTNNTEVATSGITMDNGAQKVSVPQWYSNAGAGSATVAFLVPAIVDGGSKTYDLTLSPRSGQRLGAVGTGVYTTVYTLQPAVLDTVTGKILTSNTWQDANGADKTIGNVDYDYFII